MEIEKIFEQVDEINKQDPNYEISDGEKVPKELLYSIRMTNCLVDYEDNPSFELQVATRAQHIARWKIPRTDYPMDRIGYLKWRNDLKKLHSRLISEILSANQVADDKIKRICFLIEKKDLKKDAETQILEDVVCLVFLEFYFLDFSEKHSEDKIVSIVQKTWGKMSDRAKDKALKISFSGKAKELIEKALSGGAE
ncbi:MAG: DUF4202 domain-containing protein [Flavobacteriales bacterium]|nr:DUF4202 domain-containing protein [Flavobacteriales bacterium]